MNFKISIFLMTLSFFVSAQESTIVAVGDPTPDQTQVGIKTFSSKKIPVKLYKLLDSVKKTLIRDFSFYRKNFQLVDLTRVKGEAPALDYLLELTLLDLGPKKSVTSTYLQLNLKKGVERKVVWSDKVNYFNPRDRQSLHRISDKLYRFFTGSPSVFLSQIVFVSDRPSTRRKKIKELYMMDFDGKNLRRLTRHRAMIIGPAISPDKSKIVYTLIKNRGRIKRNELRLYDVRTRRDRLILGRKGINSGAVFTHDGTGLYLSLSFQGNTEIYNYDLKTRRTRRITKHFAVDVDPSINNREDQMAFLSSRSGSAMIYTLDPRSTEKDVKRISFVGKFNATPRFSPDGKEMIFSSWSENNVFDLYRINSNGTNLVRLTRSFGSNESPSYAPDGQLVVFSSQRVLSSRKAVQNLYVMDRDDEILGPILENFGNCISPRWSK